MTEILKIEPKDLLIHRLTGLRMVCTGVYDSSKGDKTFGHGVPGWEEGDGKGTGYPGFGFWDGLDGNGVGFGYGVSATGDGHGGSNGTGNGEGRYFQGR